uniref:Protein kinase domain-containing protein n=1 Tax=Chrysotila carterae TaxID=13221 RepID=A0A7S4B6Z6_CHRCT
MRMARLHGFSPLHGRVAAAAVAATEALAAARVRLRGLHHVNRAHNFEVVLGSAPRLRRVTLRTVLISSCGAACSLAAATSCSASSLDTEAENSSHRTGSLSELTQAIREMYSQKSPSTESNAPEQAESEQPEAVESIVTTPRRLVTDDYELLESLGSGSFAVVRRARCKKTGNIVAIKVCRSGRPGALCS